MTDLETLQKELDKANLQVTSLKRRESLLRQQFSFYVQYGQKADASDIPTLIE